MVININALFAECNITEPDYFQVLLLGIHSSMEPTALFIFRHIDDAVTATFQVLVNTYFLKTSDLHCFGSVCQLY